MPLIARVVTGRHMTRFQKIPRKKFGSRSPYSADVLSELPPDAVAAVDRLLDTLAPTQDRRLAGDLLRAAAGMIADRPATLDLKIAANAVLEMRDAYHMFAGYRSNRKVTIFGSARTK